MLSLLLNTRPSLKEIKRSFGQNNTWPTFMTNMTNLRFPKELESNPLNCDNKDLFHRKKAFSNVLIMVQLLREVSFLDLNWKRLSQRNRWSEISFFSLFGVKWSFSADNCRLFCRAIFLLKLKLASRIIFSMNKGHNKNCFECMKERRIAHVIISQDYLPIFTEYFLLSAD